MNLSTDASHAIDATIDVQPASISSSSSSGKLTEQELVQDYEIDSTAEFIRKWGYKRVRSFLLASY
jgi:hypothetical protein